MPKTATAKRFLRKKLYKSGKSWVVAGAVWATAMAFGGKLCQRMQRLLYQVKQRI
ncbi:KxYKxGKxW signal peptide domain-containing protein [Bacillus subtilis]|uniref:KxYKxGKxW signal peptide domain-containing protein n=1 Tax=Bacillus subtilis TaxID=1423 RepID=UPI003982E8E6